MKNSKFVKAVAAITLSAATFAACFGATACGGHKHSWGDYTPDGEKGHYRVCTGCEEKSATKDHVWGGDNECDLCHYVKGSPEKPALTHADYVKLGADDVNDDTSVAEYQDETTAAGEIAAPKVVAYTGDGAALESGNIETNYEFSPEKFDLKTYDEGWTDGIYTIEKSTEVRGKNPSGVYDDDGNQVADTSFTKSLKMGGSDVGLNIEIKAAGTLTLYLWNGSSGTTGTQYITLTKPDGLQEDIGYPANGAGSKVQIKTLALGTAGTYKIRRKSGTTDLFYAKFTNTVLNTPIERISVVDTGKTDYFVGEQLDCTGIALTATHATTGRVSAVKSENLVLDTSKYDATTPGTYEIGVSYTVAGNLDSATTTFTTKYNVNVYSFEDLMLGFNKIVKESKNSAAGNGVYANHAVRQFYFKGDTFSYDGLSIKAKGKFDTNTRTFALKETQAVVTGGDTSTVGKKTVKVAYTANGLTKAKGFNIYVAEKDSALATANEVILAVNSEFSTATIGKKNEAGAYRFKTIQQAIDFLNNAGLKESATKTIYIAEGTYWEKLEVTVPNVTIIGAGQDKTKIEYDALFGANDEGGFTHTTDSTATLNVRDTAVGFTMKNLTVSNKYNTLDSYNGVTATNDKRALAMLIQADKVVVDNCTLLGYQDTLELFTGRQLFTNCLISGAVDFIFGTNNTTYLYKCEIKSITVANGGGYITAMKGNNKGTATDKITYGVIFDDCDFTADNGVTGTYIGRTWAADAAVMVMNSRLGGHISKTNRYGNMNADPAKAQFTEFNNTGDGAVTSLTVGKVLTETEAAKYNDLSVIFGKTNGKVTYADVWNITLN